MHSTTTMFIPLPQNSTILWGGCLLSSTGVNTEGVFISASDPNLNRVSRPIHGLCELVIPDLGKWSVALSQDATQVPGDDLFLLWQKTPESALLSDILNQLRKDQHLLLCRDQQVEGSDLTSPFMPYHLEPMAIPELDLESLDLSCRLFERVFALPILITGMTGGVKRATLVNSRLAAVASHFGVPMGLGSQRLALENEDLAGVFQIKKQFPNLYLIGNLGFSQLVAHADPLELCRRAADAADVDCMAIHLNVLQECIQPEGCRSFKGFYPLLEKLVRHLPCPLYLKEVGAGIDVQSARRLWDLGIKTIDVGGRGGTSWGFIEGQRSGDKATQNLGHTFRDWGIPTPLALQAIRRELPKMNLIATGGIRSGLDIAKALALGATSCGVGLPFMRAAMKSSEAVFATMDEMRRGLEISLLATGSPSTRHLRTRLWFGLPYQGSKVDDVGPEHREQAKA